jgi:pimeloyl-ACP methyl ester carboxylesterase
VPDATVDGTIIHYETAGQGLPLFLLHGIGSNSRSWRRQLAALSSNFTVIAWDAPGYGRSSDPPAHLDKPSMRFYADSLRALMESLGIRQASLLGHSTGGVIAQEFYRAYPDHVRALILADTRHAGSQSGLDMRLRAIRTMTPAELAVERAPKLLSRNARSDLITEVVSIMSEVRPPGYEFAAVALAESNTRDVIRDIRVPTLLIWGAEDEITPVWDEVPAGMQLKIIPDAGHLCYIEQPERFNNIVTEFLLRLAGNDGAASSSPSSPLDK